MTALAIDQKVQDQAVHGVFCPKMCSFNCPVLTATGRDDAVPWGFHRTVVALTQGALEPQAAAAGLVACTGCLACQDACIFDQDVPQQVTAARTSLAAHGVLLPNVAAVREAVAANRSPFGIEPVEERGPADASVVIVAGCHDAQDRLDAALQLLGASGMAARVVAPWPTCGGVLQDLGLAGEAAQAIHRLGEQLRGAEHVLVSDPACHAAVATASPGQARVVALPAGLAELVEDGRLTVTGMSGPVTVHDAPLWVRQHGVVAAPRQLLQAAGADLLETEQSGRDVASAGDGLGLELVDPEASLQTARRRAAQLGATGAPVVTTEAGSAAVLARAGLETTDLVVLLRDHLDHKDDS